MTPRRWLVKACNWSDFAFAGYSVFLGCIFLTNTLLLAHYIFVFVVLPTLLIGSLAASRPAGPARSSTAFYLEHLAGLFGLSRSFLLRAAAIYVLALWLCTVIYGNSGWWDSRSPIVWRAEHLALSVEVLAFVAATAFLMSKQPFFLTAFFSVMTAIVATSALVNMVEFAFNVPFSGTLSDFRLVPQLGMPEYFGSTTISLTYSVFIVGAIGTIVDSRLSYARLAVLGASIVILLLAVLWTQSRNAIVTVALSVAVIAAIKSRVMRFVIPFFVILTILLLITLPGTWDALLVRGLSYRPEIWGRYLAEASQHPLVGYGQFADIDVPMHDGFIAFHPHNLVLSAQIRGGVFAAGAMLVMLFGGLFWTWRYWLQTGKLTPFCLILVIVCAGIVDYQLLTTFPTWPWVTIWLPVGLAVGVEHLARRPALHC